MFFCPFNNGLPHCNDRINKQIQRVMGIMKDCFQLMKLEHLSYCQHKESQGSGYSIDFPTQQIAPLSESLPYPEVVTNIFVFHIW